MLWGCLCLGHSLHLVQPEDQPSHPITGDPNPTDGRWGFPDGFLDARLHPYRTLPTHSLFSSYVPRFIRKFLVWAPWPRAMNRASVPGELIP